MIKGAYLHIPFCEHICYYCDFNKVFLHKQPVMDYLKAIDKEMAIAAQKYPHKLETIFVGGGTPTALDHEQMAFFTKSIRTHLYHHGMKEYTMEANPGNLDEQKLEIMKNAGVNRLSIGVQAFQDHLLEGIGRTHREDDVFKTIETARKVGFSNISIDLMFGLPGQTIGMLKESLEKALSLDIEHISIYSLQIEPKTIFYNQMKKGQLILPGEDAEADMYDLILETLEANEFKQYEISNFAKKGFESEHNKIYWRNEEYFGFGAGAHAYVEGYRNSNTGPIKKYIRMVTEEKSAVVQSNQLTEQEKIEEELFLGLRLQKGVSKRHFQDKFNLTLSSIYGNVINNLVEEGLLEEDNEGIRLTKRGLFLGNNVFQEFLL